MAENAWLAEQFQEKRPHLRAVAYRILGSNGEADDAVQEAWLRLTRSETESPENLGGWLTTVVARVCLDMLRSRKSRKEESLEEQLLAAPGNAGPANPADEALLADSVGSALLVVLRLLTPGERVAFVLHDLFDVSFEEIAPIVGRSEAAARQLASRARPSVRSARESTSLASSPITPFKQAAIALLGIVLLRRAASLRNGSISRVIEVRHHRDDDGGRGRNEISAEKTRDDLSSR